MKMPGCFICEIYKNKDGAQVMSKYGEIAKKALLKIFDLFLALIQGLFLYSVLRQLFAFLSLVAMLSFGWVEGGSWLVHPNVQLVLLILSGLYALMAGLGYPDLYPFLKKKRYWLYLLAAWAGLKLSFLLYLLAAAKFMAK